jgi:hypothetical protein
MFLSLIVIFITLLTNVCLIRSQNFEKFSVYEDQVFSEDIHTVTLRRAGWELSYPIINLSSTEKLLLKFDDFAANVKSYQYKIIHCNASWEPSNLLFSDYMEGFAENPIDEYDYSINTFFEYIHYWLELPNDNVEFKLSGNYVIVVYEDDETNPVFTKRFFVVNPQATIKAEVKRPTNAMYSDSHQHVSFRATVNNLSTFSPMNDIFASIYQNGRWDYWKYDVKPRFIRENELLFDWDEELYFYGMKEFFTFDVKSFKYQTREIDVIDYQKPYYHVYLKPDKLSRTHPYFYNEDINGKFLIQNDLGETNDVDADYMYTHFSVPTEIPHVDGDIYVTGAFAQWKYLPAYKLAYNSQNQAYEKRVLLKQGYYNYDYVFVGSNNHNRFTYLEPSFYETENDYIICVYQKNQTLLVDELIGIEVINSLNR